MNQKKIKKTINRMIKSAIKVKKVGEKTSYIEDVSKRKCIKHEVVEIDESTEETKIVEKLIPISMGMIRVDPNCARGLRKLLKKEIKAGRL